MATDTATPVAHAPSRKYLQALGLWILFIPVAILNAGVRETFIAPAVGDTAAHVVSTVLTAIPAFSLVIWAYFTYVAEPHSRRELAYIGLMWLLLTPLFEFGFGHYVMGHSWMTLLGDYNVFAGRVWILVPIWLAIAPLLFGYYLKR